MSTGHFQKLPAAYKFCIGNVPETGDKAITVEAQFNPKDLQIDSPIGWKSSEAMGAKNVASKPMEFTGMSIETMKVELLFDAYESESDLVVSEIAKLKKMASVPSPDDPRPQGQHQRPNYCVATWGTQEPFRCVIESISVKYTMFSFDGTPVRATVTLVLKSGRRTISDAGENEFERASRVRLENQREILGKERKAHQEKLARQHDEEVERVRRVKEERATREAEALREQRKKDFALE